MNNLLLFLVFTIPQLSFQNNNDSHIYLETDTLECYQLTWNEAQISSNKVSIKTIRNFFKSELKFEKISNENVCEEINSFSGKLVFVSASKTIDPVIWFFSNSKPKIDINTPKEFDKFLVDGTTLYFEEIKINNRIPMKSLSIEIQDN